MTQGVAQAYRTLVSAGEIGHDDAQAALADRLDRLAGEIGTGAPSPLPALKRLFSRRPGTPRGVYVHGDVGRGKTMLVDMFHAALPVREKRRAHFNDFMADVHERVHAWRMRARCGEVRGDDPIAPVAADLAREAGVLCLDELHVDDIADAMILGRLFARLFERGVVLVATSNAAPGDLYAHGLNRSLFLPFVGLIEDRMDVVRLAARTDYRLETLADGDVWFSPLGEDAEAAMDATWARLAGSDAVHGMDLEVKGRRLSVPRAGRGVARFTFAQLCDAPLGPSDFLALARNFHTLFIDAIPVILPTQRNAARRFVLLIDTVYDARVKLVASAAAQPAGLYTGGPLAGEFRRTASRLTEMRSAAYLAAPHGRRGGGEAGAQEAGLAAIT